MSRTGINYQDVANAAIKVQGLSKNLTVDNIREILGIGSKSTIARHLKDWKDNNGPIANSHGLPPELIAIVSGLWERLQGHAEQQVIELQQEAKEKMQAYDLNLIQVKKKNLELQAQAHQLEETLFHQQNANKVLDQNFANEAQSNLKHQSHIFSLEAQLNSQKEENTKLHSLLKNIQSNLEHYQGSMQKVQQEQALAIEKQKHQYEQEIAELRQKVINAIQQENIYKLQLEPLQKQQSQIENITIHSQKLERLLKEKGKRIVTIEEQYKQSINNVEIMNFNLENQSKTIAELGQKAAIAVSRCVDFEKLLKEANDKISTLRHEQIFTLQEKANLEGQVKQLKLFGECA